MAGVLGEIRDSARGADQCPWLCTEWSLHTRANSNMQPPVSIALV